MKYNLTGNLQSTVYQYELLSNKLYSPETTDEQKEQLRNEIRSLADECEWKDLPCGSVLFDAMKQSVRKNLDYITVNASSLSHRSFKEFFRLLEEVCDVWVFVVEGENYYMNILIHTAAEFGYKIFRPVTREVKDEEDNTSETIYGLVFGR